VIATEELRKTSHFSKRANRKNCLTGRYTF